MAIQTRAPLDPAHLARLGERIAGELITPAHPGYETARRVWNGMIDRRPAVIARCADADDVTVAVRFADEHEVTSFHWLDLLNAIVGRVADAEIRSKMGDALRRVGAVLGSRVLERGAGHRGPPSSCG